VWDFGVVDQVQTPKLSHEFQLRNVSQKDVDIREVRSACGCMVAEGYAGHLAPGGSTILTTEVDLPPVPGKFRKKLVVVVEGELPLLLPLDVVGSIAPNGMAYSIPAEIHFGTVEVGETRARTVRVLRYDASPVDIVDVTGSDTGLECSIGSTSSQDGSPVVQVRLSTDSLSTGDYSGKVTILTKHNQHPKCEVRVSATVTGVDDGLVKSLLLPGMRPGEAREVALTRSDWNTHAPKVVSAEYDGETPLNVELLIDRTESDAPGLRVICPFESASAGIVQGAIAVTLANGKRIEIPITVVASEQL
jgi:Protein of unknown function (DUF1573)